MRAAVVVRHRPRRLRLSFPGSVAAADHRERVAYRQREIAEHLRLRLHGNVPRIDVNVLSVMTNPVMSPAGSFTGGSAMGTITSVDGNNVMVKTADGKSVIGRRCAIWSRAVTDFVRWGRLSPLL